MKLKICVLHAALSLTLVLGSASARAGVFDRCPTNDLVKVVCVVMVAPVIRFGFVVSSAENAVQTIIDAFTPSHKIDARLEDGSEIFQVKLNGFNNRSYTENPTGREKPLLLRCVRGDKDGAQWGGMMEAPSDYTPSAFSYGSCTELRPSFVATMQEHLTYSREHPIVSFRISKEGQAEPTEAILNKLLDVEKLPMLSSFRDR